MDKKKAFILAAVLVCVTLAITMVGCSEDEDMHIDDADITVEYLTDEYANQLLEDGADTLLGTVAIDETDGEYTVTVTEKEVVHNSDYKEGYYIAETNAVYDYGVGGYAKIVYEDQNGETVFSNIDAFDELHDDDSEQLFTVYVMNDNVELMLLVDPEDVENAE